MIVVLTSRPSPSPVVIICFAFSLPTSVPPSRSLTFFHLLFLFLLFFSHFISNFSFLRVLFISIIVFLHVLSIAFSFFSLLSPAFPFSVSFSYLFIYPSFFVFLSSSSPHLQRRKKAWVLQSVTKTDHVTLPLPLSPPLRGLCAWRDSAVWRNLLSLEGTSCRPCSSLPGFENQINGILFLLRWCRCSSFCSCWHILCLTLLDKRW